jgi:hypothetical protein
MLEVILIVGGPTLLVRGVGVLKWMVSGSRVDS